MLTTYNKERLLEVIEEFRKKSMFWRFEMLILKCVLYRSVFGINADTTDDAHVDPIVLRTILKIATNAKDHKWRTEVEKAHQDYENAAVKHKFAFGTYQALLTMLFQNY